MARTKRRAPDAPGLQQKLWKEKQAETLRANAVAESGGLGSVSDVILKGLEAIAGSSASSKKDPESAELSDRFTKLFAEGSGSSLFRSAKPSKSSSLDAFKRAAAVAEAALTPRPKRARTTADGKPGAGAVEAPAADAAAGTSSSSAPPRPKKRKQKPTPEENLDREARTLFVGNVPLKWDEKQLRKFLRDCLGDEYAGQLKPIWFRAIPLQGKWNWSDSMRKAGSIQKAYSDDADSKNAYVVLGLPEDVSKVSKLVNNKEADKTHVLRADGVGEAAIMKKFDRKRSVFVGNLPFRCTEAQVRDCMAPAGTVDAVRLVRDKASKECKGFAFVRYADRWSVKEALNMWPKINQREIRVMKVEDSESKGAGKGKGKEEDGKYHPALRRKQLNSASKQRQKGRKVKEFAKRAKDAGLRTGSKKAKNRASKGGKSIKKKAGGRKK
mmetsp:Transcript_70456/g.127027  ORF Transcript_70456/g.127027 Transcript_70456/m.127027 type:complete len:441 (-) Transcript_70456:47-1369(-)